MAKEYSGELISLYNKALDAVDAYRGSVPVDAPVLENYVPVFLPSKRIVMFGDAERHPILGSTLISTSDLVWIDHEARIARTVSRWYKLGNKDDIVNEQLVAAGRRIGVAITDVDQLYRMLSDKAEEFRRLFN